MAQQPASVDFTFVQSSTFLRVFRRVQNKQVITLSGTGTGTWTITLYSTTTAALSLSATAGTVQNALSALPRVTAAGVIVTGSAGGPYTLEWAGPLAAVTVPLVTVTPPTNEIAAVDYVPFDWTGWTADFKVKTIDSAVPPAFVTTVVAITDTASADGQVIIGYVPPAAEGGTPGTPAPTNGNVAILIEAAKTATMAFAGTAAKHALLMIDGTYQHTLLDGNAFLTVEPN